MMPYIVGIRCFGPSKAAARLEGSKAFAKSFMQRNKIPTARYETFDSYDDARKHIDSVDYDVVIKADGLAAGKGVIIPRTSQEAHQALKRMMIDREFGEAGMTVVIEELLEGEEISILSFSDGHTVKSLPPVQDYKRVFDGNQGPNTGGMGCYAPVPTASTELLASVEEDIVKRTIKALRRMGARFVGILFTGLMITSSGPQVLEYNVRGGDPEIQTLLPLLGQDTDLAEIMVACTDGLLDAYHINLRIEQKFSATIVTTAEGYPGTYKKNTPMTISAMPENTHVFHAGTECSQGKLSTTGGRVIATTSVAPTLESAVSQAYSGLSNIKFEGMHFRKDIARNALSDQFPTLEPGGLSYASSGVSIDKASKIVDRIKPFVRETARPGSSAEIGGFGAVFSLAEAGFGQVAPRLVSSMDGVGTKLAVANEVNRHDTVGIDLVAMNVNDVIVQGAKPVIFMDYYSCGSLDEDKISKVVSGVATGCKIADCSLVGGETAQMRGLYKNKQYNLVGSVTGVIPNGKKALPDKESMVEGDVLLGLASTGVHANGMTLIRTIIARNKLEYSDQAPWNPQQTVGESLLTPTRIYVRSLLKAVDCDRIKGMSHITGGGLVENVPRMLPDALAAEIDVAGWDRPKVFSWLQDAGKVSAQEMSRVFNNGVGMVLVVSDVDSGDVVEELQAEGETVYRVGKLVKRQGSQDQGCILRNLETWQGGD